MKPFRLVPAFLLKLVLVVPFLMCLPGLGRAQLITDAAYTTNLGSGPVEDTQKLIAVGTDGYTRFIVMESNDSGYGSQLTYVRCLDLDCDTYNTHSWHDNDTETLSPYEFSLAIGPDGYARIAYQISDSIWNSDGEATNYGILGFIQCFDDDCESSTNDDSVDYTAFGTIASVTVGSDGTAYIVYDNGNVYPGPQGIGLATCNSGGCSTSTIATGISPRDFTAAAIGIGSDGNPVVAYSDANFSSNGSYISAAGHYYQNGTDTVVSSEASFVDLASAPDGFARIYFQNDAAWDSGETPGANFIKCTNTSCSSSATNPISLTGATPYSLGSLAVAADGNPRVEVDLGSWPDSAHYVECTANDCSSYDSTLISANAGDSFPNGLTSLVADQNGIPRMITESYSTGTVYQVRATCGDHRDNLIQEYSGASAYQPTSFVPACSDFTGSASTTHYFFSNYNVSEASHYPEWALLQSYFLTGVENTVTNYGSAPAMNSSYRSPLVNYNIETSEGTGHYPNSRHVHGDATDLASDSSDWTSIHDAAKLAGACVEPTITQGGSTAHVHADWRGTCPNGW